MKLTGPYCTSKLPLSLWTLELAPTLAAEGISMLRVCPSPIKTPMTAGEGMPTWLRLLRHVFFAAPQTGANRIYGAAHRADPDQAGIFLNQGKSPPRPFAEHVPAVLAHVESLCRQEYLAAKPVAR